MSSSVAACHNILIQWSITITGKMCNTFILEETEVLLFIQIDAHQYCASVWYQKSYRVN